MAMMSLTTSPICLHQAVLSAFISRLDKIGIERKYGSNLFNVAEPPFLIVHRSVRGSCIGTIFFFG